MSTITIDGKEYNKEKVLKLIEESGENFSVKPLGDDFSMLGYLWDQYRALHHASCAGYESIESTSTRLEAVINIWKWKEKNDHGIGACWYIVFDMSEGLFGVLGSNATCNNPELPRFSSNKIAQRALEELENEYKIVFNVA